VSENQLRAEETTGSGQQPYIPLLLYNNKCL